VVTYFARRVVDGFFHARLLRWARASFVLMVPRVFSIHCVDSVSLLRMILGFSSSSSGMKHVVLGTRLRKSVKLKNQFTVTTPRNVKDLGG